MLIYAGRLAPEKNIPLLFGTMQLLDEKAPHFDKRQSAQVKTRLPSVASWRKLDDMTVEITTKEVD